jgi:multiple sugar transport system permease protein
MRPATAEAAAVRASDRRFGLLLVAPSVLILLLIGIFPLVYTLVVSFQQISMLEVDTSFAGLANYSNSCATSGCGPRSCTQRYLRPRPAARARPRAADGAALPRRHARPAALHRHPRAADRHRAADRGRRVAADVRSPLRAINQVVSWVWGEPATLLWTVNPNLVYPAILIAEIWQWTPFMFLILLAALSNVDRSLTEAAEIDGANAWLTFRRIVLPAIWPVMAIAILIRSLDLVRIFDVVWALTAGGPGTMTETISIYAYVQGSSSSRRATRARSPS